MVKQRIIKRFLFLWAFLHLTLVTLSALYIKIADFIPGKNVIDIYRKASGADSSYGFFAPAIGSKTRAVFDFVDEDGKKFENISLSSKKEREIQIRLGGLYDEFTKKDLSANFRKPLAASLAAAIFSKFTNAKEVTLHVEEFWPITMQEYQKGQRAHWSEYYQARFIKDNGAQ